MRAWVVIRAHRMSDPPPASSSTLTAVEVVEQPGAVPLEQLLAEVTEEFAALEHDYLVPVDAQALNRALGSAVRRPSRAWVAARDMVGLIVSDEAEEERPARAPQTGDEVTRAAGDASGGGPV